MGTTTQRCNEKLSIGNTLSYNDYYLWVEEIMMDCDQFKTIDSHLNHYFEKTIPNYYNLKYDERVNEIVELIVSVEQNKDSRYKKEQKTSIMGWFDGSKNSIKRESAIKLCFVLNLSTLHDVELFLGGLFMPPLNVRNAHEAIFAYGLLNKRPYVNILDLIKRYDQLPKSSALPVLGSSDTTVQLLRLIENTTWENDELFFNDFVLRNLDAFTNYSKNLYTTYYQLKDNLLCKMILSEIGGEETAIQHFCRPVSAKYTKQFENFKKYFINLYFVSFLSDEDIDGYFDNNIKKKAHLIDIEDFAQFIIKSQLNAEDVKNFRTILSSGKYNFSGWNFINTEDFLTLWEQVRQLCEETILARKFLDYCINFTGFLRNIFRDISVNGEGRCVSYNEDEEWVKAVLDNFPTKQALGNFEKDPAKCSTFIYVRKTIILFYYFDYIYDWDSEKNSETNSTKSWLDFLQNINLILQRCSLSIINPTHPFEWFILSTLQRYEKYDSDIDPDPLRYFFKFLTMDYE